MQSKGTPQKKTSEKIICQNKRASFDYNIEKRFEAGISLKGSEVKSCRAGKVQLVDAYAMIERGEVLLHKAHISEYAQSGPYFNHEAQRKRKLLLHKREIANLRALIEQQGYTLIPTRMYFKGGVAKVELGVGKGKTKGDKRDSLKEKDEQRSLQKAVRRSRFEDDE